jgi:hypothetical protein
MTQSEGLHGLLLARQPPGLRALGWFWAAVGLMLGVSTAVLVYLGPSETVAASISGAGAALVLDRTAASDSEIAEAESLRIAVAAAATPSTRFPMLPEPAPDDMTVAGTASSPVTSSTAGLAPDAQKSVLVGSPTISVIPPSSAPVVEAPRRLRILTGRLEIVRPKNPDGDALTVTIRTLPRGMVRNGTAVLKVGDQLQPEELAALVFVPEPSFTGAAGSLRYIVEDGRGGRAESTVEIEVIGAAETAAPAAPPISPPRLELSTSQGARPVYRVGDSMMLRIQPTQDAYLYCYYQDGAGEISRIFPNRFQPDAFVPAQIQVQVPPVGSGAFSIRFEQPGVPEHVACLAVDREVGLLLPSELTQRDLEPLPVRGLDEVVQRFRGVAGVQVGDVRMRIEVIRRRVGGPRSH